MIWSYMYCVIQSDKSSKQLEEVFNFDIERFSYINIFQVDADFSHSFATVFNHFDQFIAFRHKLCDFLLDR